MPEPSVLRRLLEAACDRPDFPGPLRFRAMFGGITAYSGDRNFASLSNVGLALRLSAAARLVLLAEGGTMLRYEPDVAQSKTAVVLPQAVLSDRAKLGDWAVRSARHVRALAAPKAARTDN